MSLIDVHHQPHAQRMIQRALESKRVPHAYLFHGPDGVGKEMLARGLAQLLLCPQPHEQTLDDETARKVDLTTLRVGCGQCEDCRAVARGNHPDFHLIFRQLNREHPDPAVRKRTGLEISVDVIRHFVIDACGLTPLRGQSKIFIVREADRITPQAQNALLKTLEEPPDRTFIILLTSSLDSLLPTTQSRCQLVRFDLLPREFVAAVLRASVDSSVPRPLGSGLDSENATAPIDPNPGRRRPNAPDSSKRSSKSSGCDTEPASTPKNAPPSEQIAWYAQIAQGSAGAALEFLSDDIYSLNQRVIAGLSQSLSANGDDLAKQWLDEAKTLAELYSKRDPDISDTEATRRALKTIFLLASTFLADFLHVASGDPNGITNQNQRQAIESLATHADRRALTDIIRRFAQAEHQLDLNANTQLVLDCLAADWPTQAAV